jgi:hypothetical protein
MIVSHDTSNVRRTLQTDLAVESGSFWNERAIVYLRAESDEMISVECRHYAFSSFEILDAP